MSPCGLTTHVSAERSEAETVANFYRLLARVSLARISLEVLHANGGDGISLSKIQ